MLQFIRTVIQTDDKRNQKELFCLSNMIPPKKPHNLSFYCFYAVKDVSQSRFAKIENCRDFFSPVINWKKIHHKYEHMKKEMPHWRRWWKKMLPSLNPKKAPKLFWFNCSPVFCMEVMCAQSKIGFLSRSCFNFISGKRGISLEGNLIVP